MTLKEARKAKELTQEKMAEMLHVNTNRYISWEYGRVGVPQRMFDRITEILGTVPDDVTVRSPNGGKVKMSGKYEAFCDTISIIREISSDEETVSRLIDDMLNSWKKELSAIAGIKE